MILEDLAGLAFLGLGGAAVVTSHSPPPEGGGGSLAGYVIGGLMFAVAATFFVAARDVHFSGSLNRKPQWIACAALVIAVAGMFAVKSGTGH